MGDLRSINGMIDLDRCCICDSTGVNTRLLKIEYGANGIMMAVCVECMKGNTNEIAQEIKEKALFKFAEQEENKI